MRGKDPHDRAATARPATEAGFATIGDRLNHAAPLLFVLLWSSSFLGTRVGLRHMSPLWFVALRMILASAIISGVLLMPRRPWSRRQLFRRQLSRGFGSLSGRAWLHCAVVGVTTQAILLMTAHVAMTRVPAAPIALIQTLNPLLCALLAWPLLGERLRPSQILGLLLGFAGVLLILGLAALRSRAELPDLLGAIAGVCCLAGGTLYFRRFCRAIPPLPGAAAQFLASAVVCTGSASVLETFWTDGNLGAFAGIAWNTIAVSMGGMALYFLMLTHGTAARATVNFYLVPGVTSVLTWAILGERLTPIMVLGLGISSTGCWLVGRRPSVT
jgi:drug/metabolite transporter (DMT)-like permease